VSSTLVAELADATSSAEGALERAAGVLRAAFEVERVSVARIDPSGERFEIAADSGFELLAPGTVLPVNTCSYFALTADGHVFSEPDFDASQTFRRPLDSVVLATGFHSGCSVPLRRGDRTVGALSLSSSAPRRDMRDAVAGLEAVRDVVAGALIPPVRARPAHVLVCHADALAARGIARLIERDGAARASVSPTLDDALTLAVGTTPDFVVCDDWVDGLRVDEVARRLREAGVTAPLVVVSSHDTPESVRASLRAGAAAHVPRREAVRALPLALATVSHGGTLLPEAAPEDGAHLTDREHEVLGGLEEGLRFKQIARRLGISEATAKTHGRNLFRKLDVTSRGEAVHTARERGLLA